MRTPGYITTFLQVILVSVFESGVTALTCLRCDDIALPTLCRTIDRCGSHELCGLVQFVTPIGSLRFQQMCVDKNVCPGGKREIRTLDRSDRSVNTRICLSCCDSDMCNSGGCRQQGFTEEDKAHMCYNCGTQIGSDMCDTIETCSRDQICQIKPLKVRGAPTNLFKTQCQHPQSCSAQPNIIGRKRAGWSTCCNGTLCNDYDPASPCPAQVSSTAGPAVTTASTTPSTTLSYPAVTSPTTTKATTTAPITTTEPRTTTAPRTTKLTTSHTSGGHIGFGDCKDIFVCNPNFCTLPEYKDFVEANCKFTCNLCSGSGGHNGPELDCKDSTPGCNSQTCVDYRDYALTNCEKTCGYCQVRASAKEGYGWYLLMKSVTGVTQPTPDIYSIYRDPGSLNIKIPAYADYTDKFHGHYKTQFSDSWDSYHFDKVNVSMYINGTERVFLTFNSTGSDKLSWFQADRVIASSWAPHHTHVGNVQMDLIQSTGFEFHVGSGSHTASSCDATGWMTVVVNNNCVHDTKLHFPAFLFCPGHQPCKWSDHTYSVAEVFEIHAHSPDSV